MTKALELAKFGRESAPTGLVVGDSDAQTLSSKTFSDGPVFSGLNANGIPYLNASKVLSSSSTFVFDGTNIGLGIASPAATLHVNASGGGTIRASRSSVGGEYIQLDHDGTDGTLRVSGNNKLYLTTNGSTRVTVLGGGNVGVGIQAPTAILHTQSSGLGDGGGIKLGNSGSGGGTFAIWPTATINGEGADKLIFSGTSGNLFTIAGTGNVGVGTTTPGAKLDVNGSLKSQGFTGTSSNILGGANQVTLDYLSGSGGARLLGWGPNTTTRGGIAIAVVSSDASLYTDAIRIDSSAVVGIGTTPNSNGKLSIYDTTVAKLFLTDSTLGTSYGGQIRGYGTTGAGGFLELGVVDANTFNSAIKVFNQATQISFSINSGTNGSTSERMRIDVNGAAHFYQAGAAGYGGVNLTSADPFIRFTSTGTTDKKKWDVRAISASGSEALEFRTINDANTVFSTKLWIAHGGNVGIGTTAPNSTLHVAGTFYSSGAIVGASYASVGSIVANDPGASYYSYNNRIGGGLAIVGNTYHVGNTDTYTDMTATTGWVRSTVRNGVKAAFTGVYRVSGNGVSSPGIFVHNSDLNAWDDLYINCHDDGSGGVGGGTGNKIIMGGKVGIGTINPTAKLEVKMTGDGDIFIGRYSAGAAKLVYAYQSASDGYLELRTGADNIVTKLSGYTGTPSYFLSNVAVGHTSAAAKLHVGGGSAAIALESFKPTVGFARSIEVCYGESGTFSSITIQVNMGGAGGWCYELNTGGTGNGYTSIGGGYINGPQNFSHSSHVNGGNGSLAVSCPQDNILRFVVTISSVHPVVTFKITGSLNQPITSGDITVTFA